MQAGLYAVLSREEEVVWGATCYLQNLQKPKSEAIGKSLFFCLLILFDGFELLLSNRQLVLYYKYCLGSGGTWMCHNPAGLFSEEKGSARGTEKALFCPISCGAQPGCGSSCWAGTVMGSRALP